MPDRIHSVRPVPRTIQSYSSSIALKTGRVDSELLLFISIKCGGKNGERPQSEDQLLELWWEQIFPEVRCVMCVSDSVRGWSEV